MFHPIIIEKVCVYCLVFAVVVVIGEVTYFFIVYLAVVVSYLSKRLLVHIFVVGERKTNFLRRILTSVPTFLISEVANFLSNLIKCIHLLPTSYLGNSVARCYNKKWPKFI